MFKSKSLVLLVTGSVSAVAITTFVDESRQKPKEANFQLGSADEDIANKLKEGDLLLFKRKWYFQKLPFMPYLPLTHWLHGSDYDHCGLVVMDPLQGIPYVLEVTPFGGSKLRTYEQRVLHTQAALVCILPLSAELSQSTRDSLWKYAEAVSTENNASFIDNECILGYAGLLMTVWNGFVLKVRGAIEGSSGRSGEDRESKLIRYQCPSVELVMNALIHVDLNPRLERTTKSSEGFSSSDEVKRLSCSDLLHASDRLAFVTTSRSAPATTTITSLASTPESTPTSVSNTYKYDGRKRTTVRMNS